MKRIIAAFLLLAALAAPAFAEGYASVIVAPDFFWGGHTYVTNGPSENFVKMRLSIGFDGANFFGDSGFGVEYGAGGSMLYAERKADEPLAFSSSYPWDFYFNIGLGYKFVQQGFFTARVGFGLLADIDVNEGGADGYRGIILDFYASVKAMFSVASNVSIDIGARFATPLFSARFSGNDSQERISGASVAPSLSVTYWY